MYVQLERISFFLFLIEWDEPYLIGVVQNGMEVRCVHPYSLTDNTLIQSFPKLSKVNLLTRSGKGYLFAASMNELWYIQSVDIPKQRQALLQQKNWKLSLLLTVNAKIYQFRIEFLM